MRVGIDLAGLQRVKSGVEDESAVIATALQQAARTFAGVRQVLGPRAVAISRTLGDLDAASLDTGRSALFRTSELLEAVQLGVADFLKHDSEAAEELAAILRTANELPDVRL